MYLFVLIGGLMFHTPLRRKFDFPILLNELGLTGHGAEVGVDHAGFAAHIMRNWRQGSGSHYYLVDLYSENPKVNDKGRNQEEQNKAFLTAQENVKEFGQRAVFMRQHSREAPKKFPDNHLDFVYVDAMHTYDDCLKDIIKWYPKVRPGGVVAGDDYANADEDWYFNKWHMKLDWGVKAAVHDFFRCLNIPVFTTYYDDARTGYGYPCWYVIKP